MVVVGEVRHIFHIIPYIECQLRSNGPTDGPTDQFQLPPTLADLPLRSRSSADLPGLPRRLLRRCAPRRSGRDWKIWTFTPETRSNVNTPYMERLGKVLLRPEVVLQRSREVISIAQFQRH